MANTVAQTINLTSLDFATNKAAFLQYLTQQPQFKDYDFTGSNINVLLDILALNFYRHAFYTNMDISEGFLDSAQLSNSVKSHAKELNYLPRSTTSAQANVTVTFTASGQSSPYIIPKGSQFSASSKSQNFVFSTAENITCASPNTSFSFSTAIYEGPYVKDSFIYNSGLAGNTRPSFIISNPQADISSLTVNVFQNNSVVPLIFNLTTSLLDLDNNSQVYFLQCDAVTGSYEVLFGDGVLGMQPQNGALVVLDYRVSSGGAANNCGLFQIAFDPTGAGELITSPITTTTQIAIGGANAEDIETTRFNAPRWFEVQERCIVPADYEIVLQAQFPEIQAIHAYGGETLTPPQFGKVVIAVFLINTTSIPNSKILQYTNFIKGRNPLSIQPIFVSPTFTFIAVNSLIKYNVNITVASSQYIESIVAAAIEEFNDSELEDFDVTFYFSEFVDMISDSDPSIISNITTIQLYQKIQPTDVATNYSLLFGVPLANNIPQLPAEHADTLMKTLSSTAFTFKGNLSQLEDDGAGTIRIVNVSGNSLSTAANIGVITYETGQVQLNNFQVDNFEGDNMLVYVVPASDDVTVTQNTILGIEPDQVQLTATPISVRDRAGGPPDAN